MATVTPYFATVKVTSPISFTIFSFADFLRIQSFADVLVTTDGVETAAFLEASDGLVNMFGAHLKGPTIRTVTALTGTPTERSPWNRRVFFCPGRSASQHRGAHFPAFRIVRRCPRQSILTDQCNRNRGSGPVICPISRYPQRLRNWLPARLRKVPVRVPPVSFALYGT